MQTLLCNDLALTLTYVEEFHIVVSEANKLNTLLLLLATNTQPLYLYVKLGRSRQISNLKSAKNGKFHGHVLVENDISPPPPPISAKGPGILSKAMLKTVLIRATAH